MSLLYYHTENTLEAGCDEAGRGCIAGPVCAAAVIMPPDFYHPLLNDSKKLNEKTRYLLRPIIEKEALAFGVAFVDAPEIDKINILQASFKAMHLALDKLQISPQHLIIDGNRFIPYRHIPHTTIIKGDSKYTAIAAASILAKTYRDDCMMQLHQSFPQYQWQQNKGYPTISHRKMVSAIGLSPYHRKTFACVPKPIASPQ
ncbi:MAG: ribonuclease HII [Bacteroidetes bacterium]|jgi:ribonuclease HII|nr:ribonuclease HII [Bacteroidota bacterium]